MGKTLELLFSPQISLFAPEYLLEEVKEHFSEILDKSNLDRTTVEIIFSVITSRINFVSVSEFESNLTKAKAICPDEDDVEYFALALSRDCPFWSNDQKLKKQNEVKVISTSELINLLSIF